MATTQVTAPFPAPEHDHASCERVALDRVRAAFERQGLRLTPLRQMVFEEIASTHRAIGAYDLVERFAAKGRRLAPISVYRALESLTEAGVVHRFESRNSYFACVGAHDRRQPALFLACKACGAIAELPGERIFDAIEREAKSVAFATLATVVEVVGLCAHCARKA